MNTTGFPGGVSLSAKTAEGLPALGRAHGVQYIGHVIEDDGQHCRTGSSLGHYFRGLGIQIAPPFRYDLTAAVAEGENKLVIEVATTLERQTFPMLKGYRKLLATKPESATGLTGTVKLITR